MLTRRIVRIFVAALVSAVTTAGAAMPSVYAATASAHMQMFDVSHDPIQFLDSHVMEVAGAHVNGGCKFTVFLSRGPSEQRVGSQEIGRDPLACVELVRIGHVNAVSLPTGVNDRKAGDPCDDEFFGWYDPFGIKLTDVDTGGCFSYNGTYVGGCYQSYNSVYAESPTGWYVRYRNNGGSYYNSNYTQCYAWSAEQFENDTFCPAGSTYTNYYDNELIMQGNGWVGDGTSSWSSGQCTNLMHSWSNL